MKEVGDCVKAKLLKKADVTSLPLYILEKLENWAKPHDPNASFRFVGGCVRDTLLGHKPKDYDVVTNTSSKILEKMGLEDVGKAYPVYLYQDEKYGQIEVAVARTEEKTGIGHKGFETTPTSNFEDDVVRRDLTVNALMVDVNGDLTGSPKALEHIKSKILENNSDKFGEDALRVFRTARFAAQFGPDWQLSPQLLSIMKEMQGELASLSSDRVREEFRRAMGGKSPARFFAVLRISHCLSPWFSELEQNWNGVMVVVYYGGVQDWSFEQFLIGIGGVLSNPNQLMTRLNIGNAEKRAIHYIQTYKALLENPKQYDTSVIIQLIQNSRGILPLDKLLDCALSGGHTDSKNFLLACQEAMRRTNMEGVTGKEEALERLLVEVKKVNS